MAVPELDTTVFLILGECVKNGDHRLVVLNRVAHYSAAQLQNLFDAANRVCDAGSRESRALAMLKRRAPCSPRMGEIDRLRLHQLVIIQHLVDLLW